MSKLKKYENEPQRAFAPAAERNKVVITAAISSILPETGLVLELASGTGQHVVHFAEHFPELEWQPSDVSLGACASISAYMSASSATNIKPPIELDVERDRWPVARVDAILAINLVHIAPWSVTSSLFREATGHLTESGVLIMYGPYQLFGHYHAPSNRAFDARLRSENPEWGVRDVRDIVMTAAQHGFVLNALLPMPANNHILVFRRQVS
ncbi:MAG: DUF938 domain-containing protein [Bradymonadia bacterium]